MKLSKITMLLMVFFVVSCTSIKRAQLYEMNPCFHLDNDVARKECLDWRRNYPLEYYKFYDRCKKTLPDSVWRKLPTQVEGLKPLDIKIKDW